MNFLSIAILLVASNLASSKGCGMVDFLEQLTESVKSIQHNGQSCGSTDEPKVGKAGPQGVQGPRGPPGIVDMVAIEKRIQHMIEESRQYLMRLGEMCYLGMKSRVIPDSAVTASSYHAKNYEPYRARIDDQIEAHSYGCWAPRSSAVGQWLQIDIGRVTDVAGIITQGRPRLHNQWVTSYKVSWGVDPGHLAIMTDGDGREKIFDGNRNMDMKVYNRFPEVLSCRYIRIYPQAWHGFMSMRVELVSGVCFNFTTPW